MLRRTQTTASSTHCRLYRNYARASCFWGVTSGLARLHPVLFQQRLEPRIPLERRPEGIEPKGAVVGASASGGIQHGLELIQRLLVLPDHDEDLSEQHGAFCPSQ